MSNEYPGGVSTAEAAAGFAKVAEAMAESNTAPVMPEAVTLEELEALAATGAFSDEEEAARQPWAIRDDGAADWAVQKIAIEREELERIKALAAEQKKRIDDKVEAAQRRYDSATAFLTGKLAQYFQTVPHKATKTKQSYRLLSGSLTMKIGQPSMKMNEGVLLDHLKASGLSQYIKTEERVTWGEYKKRLEITEAGAIDKETGELVEGVDIEIKPDVFTVDV